MAESGFLQRDFFSGLRLSVRLRGLSVGSKLILIYLVGIFIPLVLANGLALRGALRDAAAQEREFLTATVEGVRDAIARELEPIELVADFVYSERSIYTLLNQSYDQFGDFVEAHRDFLVPALTKYAFVAPGVSRITVYTENNIVGVSSGYLLLAPEVLDSEWLQRFEESGREIIALVHIDDYLRTEVIPTQYVSLVRELDAPSLPQSGRMILRVDINPLVFQRHLTPYSVVGSLEVVDPSGAVAADRVAMDDEHDYTAVSAGFASDGPLAGWRVRGSVALADTALVPSARWTLLLVVSGLSVAVSSLLILLLSRSVTARLRSVSRQMHKVEREDFSPVIVKNPGDDEVGQLIADYNLMAGKVEALINDRYRAELERNRLVVAQQQAELDALQSQVNPHYLFNVLESVRMKSHIRGEHETAAVVKRISKSVRRLTSWDEDLVRIDEELEFTREYIKIQQYRFGDRLREEIDLDPRASRLFIPKLTIQGLVENACVHGLEPQPEGGLLSVTVQLDAGALTIEIRDDGVGCDPATVERLIHRPRQDGRHLGIANIYRRLHLHYGKRAELGFQSAPGDGTRVSITIEEAHELAAAAHR